MKAVIKSVKFHVYYLINKDSMFGNLIATGVERLPIPP